VAHLLDRRGIDGADGELFFPHPTSLTLGHRFLKVCLPPASIRLKDSLRSATPPGEGFGCGGTEEDDGTQQKKQAGKGGLT